MILNIKRTQDPVCNYDIFGIYNGVQASFHNLKNYYSHSKNHDQKIIQNLHHPYGQHKRPISKAKRILQINRNYERKQKQPHFSISSTPNFNRIFNTNNQHNKNNPKPKKTLQITKINNLLNQFKTKYDALSKKINLKTQPSISSLNVSNKLNSIVHLSRTPIKSIDIKDSRFSIQPKTFDKQSYQVISSPNLKYSKSVQNLPNFNFALKTFNIPDTFDTFNGKTILNQRSQCQQDKLNVSIEMVIQNNNNVKDKKKFPSLQTVLSQNDICSQLDENQSDTQSFVQGTFKQFPSLLTQRQIFMLKKVHQNHLQQQLLPDEK